LAKLTALKVKNTGPGRHGDGGGLFLVVRPEGSKAWVLRVQLNGKRRDFGLGGVDVLPLGEAREKAAAWRKLAKSGMDPSVEAKRVTTVIPTFEKAAAEYHVNAKRGWKNSKHANQWISTLKAYAYPTLGKLSVNAIDAPLIWSALGAIWQEKPETARRVRQRIASVLDYAKANGWRETEAPMRALGKIASRQTAKAGNFAAMPYAAMPVLLACLRDAEQTMGRRALQFTLLTAARSGEVRGARWREIDLDAAEWTVPAERMKMGRQHIVPLPAPAVAILRHLAGLLGHKSDELVFPGLRNAPLSDMTLAKVFRTAGGAGYTVHGTARSSFRDWVAEQCPSVPGDVAEAALAHQVKDKTERAYRRATYLEERRKLMAAWADYLVSNSNVVPLAALA
jgi:integrase